MLNDIFTNISYKWVEVKISSLSNLLEYLPYDSHDTIFD